MANFLVQNCINPQETYIVAESKEALEIGDVIRVGSGGVASNDYGCFTVVESTLTEPTASVGSPPYPSCKDCYDAGSYYYLFTECNSEIPQIFPISSTQFQLLPTIGNVLGMTISGNNESLCYEFINVSQSAPFELTIQGEVSISEDCKGCGGVTPIGFQAEFNQTLYKNSNYDLSQVVSLSGNYQEPVSFSFGMFQPKNVTIFENTLQIGDFLGVLEITVQDSTDQSTILTGDVTNRFIALFNQDILINNTYDLDKIISISGDCSFPVSYSLRNGNDLPFNPTPLVDVIIDFPIDIDKPVQENPIQIIGNSLIVGDSLVRFQLQIFDSTQDYYILDGQVLSRVSFNTLVQEYTNNPGVQQKYSDFKNNYSNYINNRGGGNPAQEAK